MATCECAAAVAGYAARAGLSVAEGANALAIGLSNAALITYISALPFIVEDACRRSPQLFSLASRSTRWA